MYVWAGWFKIPKNQSTNQLMNELITQLFEHPIDQSMTQPVTGANHENSPVINQTASDRNQQEHRKRKSRTTLATAHHYL